MNSASTPDLRYFDDLSLEQLRGRQSAKWTGYGGDVLPAWVAEMDFPLDPAIAEALREAVSRSDLGYASPREYGQAYASFMQQAFGWRFSPRDVMAVADVMTGVRELLHALTSPGDTVIINPPVYPPFFEVGRIERLQVVPVPLQCADDGQSQRWSLDLAAIEHAYAAPRRSGERRVHLLCSPHNPTGTVHAAETLRALSELAARHDVLILSDEIHAPMTHVGATHVPLASLGAQAAEHCITLTSASKTWNLPGLKAAAMIATSDRTRGFLRQIPKETPWHAGHLGVIAGEVALREGKAWRARAMATLERNRQLLSELLAEHAPRVRYTPPQASYLAWLDFRALDLGDDPGLPILKRSKLALSNGPMFGEQGRGFARLNFATSRGLLEEAVRRIGQAIAAR